MDTTGHFLPSQDAQSSHIIDRSSDSSTVDSSSSSQSNEWPGSVYTPSIRPLHAGPPVQSPWSPTSSMSSAYSPPYNPHAEQRPPLHRQSQIRPKLKHDEPRDFTGPLDQEWSHAKSQPEDSIPVTTDFVRTLFQLLEDNAMSDVLCWGPQGDFFVIKDVNTFTTKILPYTFKHSNFASFVRQLNKYDFHKIRTGDDNPFGVNSWLFRHTDFRAGRLDILENIKRKVPGVKKWSTSPQTPAAAPNAMENLQAQAERMAQQQDVMTMQLHNVESEYVGVVDGMLDIQRNLAQQRGTVQQMMQYLAQQENGGKVSSSSHLG